MVEIRLFLNEDNFLEQHKSDFNQYVVYLLSSKNKFIFDINEQNVEGAIALL